jgi:hypothetical protein
MRAAGGCRPRWPLSSIVTVMVAASLLLGACADDAQPPAPDGDTDADETEPEPTAMPLTGVETDEVPERPALMVKVSNSPEARPQTGLEVADLVYEELTEGGITRFMAVFHSRLPEVVGPVRSARPVDVQLISGFGTPGFAYSGARDEVRAMLADAPAAPITEGAPGFFRDDGAYASTPVAPHDLFLRGDEALGAVVEGGAQDLGDLGWVFTTDAPDGGTTDVVPLDVAMSPSYVTTWAFDEEAGLYRRQQNGADFLVTGPDRIGAANVVVLAVRHYIGESGYPETDVLGEGDALILRDGQRYAARWSKLAATDPLQLLTSDGTAPFPLRPGPTWLLLPDDLPPIADELDGDADPAADDAG